jgi:acyl-coenzyme A synthetase/AMP-(fatty) acid ligase
MVILDTSFWSILEDVRDELPALKHVIVARDPAPKTAHRFQVLISGPSGRHDPVDVPLDDLASIIYTSGTTGKIVKRELRAKALKDT